MNGDPVSKGAITDPYVLGAVIDMGNCLNLMDQAGLDELKTAHKAFKSASRSIGNPLPSNKIRDKGGAFLRRELDCGVIEFLHAMREYEGLREYDSVISALWEGGQLYKGAGFKSKNHIQICVRNPSIIQAYFRVRNIDGFDVKVWDPAQVIHQTEYRSVD